VGCVLWCSVCARVAVSSSTYLVILACRFFFFSLAFFSSHCASLRKPLTPSCCYNSTMLSSSLLRHAPRHVQASGSPRKRQRSRRRAIRQVRRQAAEGGRCGGASGGGGRRRVGDLRGKSAEVWRLPAVSLYFLYCVIYASQWNLLVKNTPENDKYGG
jgi:hypothetical protein